MAKTQANFPASLDTLDTDRTAGQVITSDSYDVIETAITEIEKVLGSTVVYPQAFATGTGTSGDPWAGWQAAAYAACPTNGTIYLRAGYYQLAGAFAITKSINVIGEGIGKTIIRTANTDGIWAEADYLTFKGFTVDADAQTLGSYSGFNIEGDYFILEDIEVKNAGYYGLAPTDSSYGSYRNIYIHGCYYVAVHMASDTGNNNYNNFRNIYCWDNTNGVTGGGGFGDRGGKFAIYDNIHCWNNNWYGIGFEYLTDCVLSNSSASGNVQCGIYLGSCEGGVTINNCSLTLNGTSGVTVNDSNGVYFTNVISKNNNTTDTENSGFYLIGCDNITFTSCQSYDDRGVGMLQEFGLLTENDTGITLLNCKFLPNAIGEIHDPDVVVTTMMRGVVDGYKAVAGDIQYHNGTNWVRLAKGSSGQVLTMNGGATAPAWVG